MNPVLERSRLTLQVLLQRAREHPHSKPEEEAAFLLRPGDWPILTRPGGSIESWSEADRKRNVELFIGAFVGFFDCAADGYAFVPFDRIRQRFGRTLEETYPEASSSFLKFARTYWTLKTVYEEQALEHPEMTLTYLLGRLDQDIAGVFFPTPGSMTIPASQGERKQRETLRQFAHRIDIEDFIRGNPILVRYRARSSGCMGVLVVLGLVLAALASIAFH